MLYTVVFFALFFAVMAGWRFVVTHVVYDYGFVGWLILMAGMFAFAWWIEKKWPSPDPFPGTFSRTLRRRFAMAFKVDLATRAAVLAIFFACLYAFPRDWMAYWMIPLGLAYLRWAALQVRHEKKLWEEGDGGQDHQCGAHDSDRLLSDSRRFHRLGSDRT
jgi:hypothetical protein